ncbi:MAG TPA: hybrid sensor histidine kinase/response regulator [Thermoanaerobaculia bacterium]|nr:hybrid sensor histidine kinase/response regulator [Thermoanaerobaculia bacterium]
MAPPTTSDRRDWRRLTLDSLGEAIVTVDSEGRITCLNPAAERLLGTSLRSAKDQPLNQVLRLLDQETGSPVHIPISEPGLLEAKSLARRRLQLEGSAQERRFQATVEGIRIRGDFVGAVVVLRDVSDRLQEEEELRRRAEDLAGADRRKDQFLAMLAHELRNPLAPIRNAVELMRQVETHDPSFQPSREMVERQVKNLARLVDDLLDVSRISQGSIRLRKEAVDLGAVVERAIEATRPLIEARGHTLSVRLPTDSVRLEADPTRLEQVVANLLNNAAKYTMPGGQIQIKAGLDGNEAVVRVRDNGIGVPPDVLDRVFEPFVQSEGSLARSEGGLGIGLTLAKSLVEMHGGSIEAHSPGLGQGSEFVVRLPARPPVERTASPPLPEPASRFSARALRVLVVEDNLDTAESLAALLRLWGHEVRVVHDGLSAVDAAHEQHPEVVLLDIGLPGLDGYQVADTCAVVNASTASSLNPRNASSHFSSNAICP